MKGKYTNEQIEKMNDNNLHWMALDILKRYEKSKAEMLSFESFKKLIKCYNECNKVISRSKRIIKFYEAKGVKPIKPKNAKKD